VAAGRAVALETVARARELFPMFRSRQL
jgi:hypothetical protein